MAPPPHLANFKELEAYLGRFTNYERFPSIRYDRETLGLERMAAYVEALGHPDRSAPAVHIAGTKGKGTTTLILEAILRAEGLKVGCYLSPHVEHLRERIRLHGRPASESAYLAAVNDQLPLLEELRSRGPQAFPTFFELMTALAMCLFRREGMDWGLYEVGLGGRLDATNVLQPRWTCITSIGLEHTQQLGNTLALIAREKAGIIKPGTPLVLGPLPPEARTPILEVAAMRGAPVLPLEEDLVTATSPDRIGVKGLGELPAGAVVGPALRTDLGLALTLARGVLGETGRAPDTMALGKALRSLSLPARVERFPGSPPVILDAAHTAESVRALRVTLDEIGFPRPRTLVFSLAQGKNLSGILAELGPLADETLWTLADPARSIPPAELREAAGRGQVIESPVEALREALRRGHPVIVTGSFYLAGALRPELRATRPPGGGGESSGSQAPGKSS